MLNLIKMDLYRLLHSKAIWVTLVYTIGFSFLLVFMSSKMDALVSFVQQIGTEVTVTNGMLEIPKIGTFIIDSLQTQIWFFACAIAVAVFAGAEYKNGYIKNIAGLFPNKAVLVFSKFITIALEILFMMLVYCGATFVFSILLLHSEIQMDSLLPFIQSFLMLFLVYFAMGSVIYLFTALTRNTVISIILAVMMVFSIISSIAQNSVNMLIKIIIPSSDFDLNYYLLTPRLSEISMHMSQDTAVHALVIACAFILVSAVISAVVMHKRDVA